MNILKKGCVAALALMVCSYTQASSTGNFLKFTGTVNSSVQMEDCHLIVPMNYCWVFEHAKVLPQLIPANSSSPFYSIVETGTLNYSDIWRNSYTLISTYHREDGSEGVVTSFNSDAANFIVGKTWDDIFNADGYGYSEDVIVQAIHDTYSTEWQKVADGNDKLSTLQARLMGSYVKDGDNEIAVVAEFGKSARLMAFSDATDVGGVQLSPTAVPGPAAGLAMVIGLIGTLRRSRRKSA